MYIYPDYYKQFACIGKDCISTCCVGWGVELDEETVRFYRDRTDEFGRFVQANIEEVRDGGVMVVLPDSKRCPFLDEEGLCRIFIHYGEESLSRTCTRFPRRQRWFNENFIGGMSLSCERVLEMLWEKKDDVSIVEEKDMTMTTMGDLAFVKLKRFLAEGIALLQDSATPFGVSLGTVIYTGIEAGQSYKEHDFGRFDEAVDGMPEVAEQFRQSERSLSEEEIKGSAWTLIFGVVDTFCHVLKEQNVFGAEKILWPESVFSLSDGKRRQYLCQAFEKQSRGQEYKRFVRRLAAACFFGHAMALGAEDGESIFLESICPYLVIAAVLPFTWDLSGGACALFPRLSYVARQFEQPGQAKDIFISIIRELFAPDVFAYTTVFMALFD